MISYGIVPFDQIIEVDDVGDDMTEHPHIYVRTPAGKAHPAWDFYSQLSYSHGWGNPPDPFVDTRVARFPAEFRTPFPAELEKE